MILTLPIEKNKVFSRGRPHDKSPVIVGSRLGSLTIGNPKTASPVRDFKMTDGRMQRLDDPYLLVKHVGVSKKSSAL